MKLLYALLAVALSSCAAPNPKEQRTDNLNAKWNLDKPCPSLANFRCKWNWDSISLGMEAEKVLLLLGSSDDSSTTRWNYNLGAVYFESSYGGIQHRAILAHVCLEDGKVTCIKKPLNYGYLQPGVDMIQDITPVAKLISNCPRLGLPTCKTNWSSIKQGLNKDQVEVLLGSPDSIENLEISSGIVKVEEKWRFRPEGELQFFNGLLVTYKKPNNYEYLGELDTIQ